MRRRKQSSRLGGAGQTWITRTETAYVARVPLPLDQQEGDAKALNKSFSFSRYSDGEAGALKAAKAWRDYHAKKVYGDAWKERLLQARNRPRQKKRDFLDQEAGVTYVSSQIGLHVNL